MTDPRWHAECPDDLDYLDELQDAALERLDRAEYDSKHDDVPAYESGFLTRPQHGPVR
jgi:hypothetical protein